MKVRKNLLYFCLAVCGLAVFEIKAQQYISVPDQNFEKSLSLFDDISDDGRIPVENIRSVTVLNVVNKDISDLTGIEGFLSLEVLDCSTNFITELDLSKNMNLKVLRCDRNALKYIDVSNNKLLKFLSCNENKLLNLDVSKNLNLINLSCLGNLIKHLNLSKNSFLEQLYCQLNRIEYLDVSTNSKLSSLYCHSNDLKFLNVGNRNNVNLRNFYYYDNPFLIDIYVDDDVSENRALIQGLNWRGGENVGIKKLSVLFVSIPDTNFERALIKNDVDKSQALDGIVLIGDIESVEELDISTSRILNLEGIERFKNLRKLNCSRNLLRRLDLSKNVKLEFLDCSYNALDDLFLSKNLALESLNVSVNKISTIDLSENIALEELNVGSNDIEDIDLSKNIALKSIDCTENNLDFLNLSQNRKVVSVKCFGNEKRFHLELGKATIKF